jgi:hypothetical protein
MLTLAELKVKPMMMFLERRYNLVLFFLVLDVAICGRRWFRVVE